MGYEDGLYNAKNIIGYTGQIGNSPTVYFLEPEGNPPRKYGHITQDHWLWLNNGREAARSAENYTYENNGNGVLVEKDNGKIIHTSRNRFIDISNCSDKRGLLEAAINRFQERKSIYEPQYYHLIQSYLFGAKSDDALDEALSKVWGGQKFQGDAKKVWSEAWVAPRRPRGD